MSTREGLIAAATDLLDAGGVDAVTLREVGRRAGVSHNAPYKHFTDKEALLAAIAARELDALTDVIVTAGERESSALAVLRRVMDGYVAWALAHPRRFTLVFGAWPTGSPELDLAAGTTWARIVEAVAAAQTSGDLPAGDPERLAALIRALAHGAIDLAITGHLAAEGKGHAGPGDLVGDLFDHLVVRPAVARHGARGGTRTRTSEDTRT